MVSLMVLGTTVTRMRQKASRCMNFVAAWKYYSAEGKEKDGDKTLFRESEASPDLGFTQVMLSIEVFCNLFLFIPSQLIY